MNNRGKKTYLVNELCHLALVTKFRFLNCHNLVVLQYTFVNNSKPSLTNYSSWMVVVCSLLEIFCSDVLAFLTEPNSKPPFLSKNFCLSLMNFLFFNPQKPKEPPTSNTRSPTQIAAHIQTCKTSLRRY